MECHGGTNCLVQQNVLNTSPSSAWCAPGDFERVTSRVLAQIFWWNNLTTCGVIGWTLRNSAGMRRNTKLTWGQGAFPHYVQNVDEGMVTVR